VADDWGVPQNAEDLHRSYQKRLARQERRTDTSVVISNLGALLGQTATETIDWNSDVCVQNGFVYSRAGALHAPTNEAVDWSGIIIARSDGSGSQDVWDPSYTAETLHWTRMFSPSPTDPAVVVFGPWREFATHSGKIDFPQLSGGVKTDIQKALDDSAEALGFKVFRQPTPPAGPLPNGSVWFDTDNGNHPYTWSVTANDWVDVQDAAAAAGEAGAEAAQEDATQALADAAAAIAAAGEAAADATHAQVDATLALAGRASDTYLVATPVANQLVGQWASNNGTVIGLGADSAALDGQAWICAPGAPAGPLLYAPYYSLLKPGRYNVTYYVRTSRDPGDRGAFARVAVHDAASSGGIVEHDQYTDLTAEKLAATSAGAYGSFQIPMTITKPNVSVEFYLQNYAGDWAASHVVVTPADSKTITAGLLQSRAEFNRGIKLTRSDLIAYNSGGVPTLFIDGESGNVTLAGSVAAGVDVSGATVTGGIVQTEATPQRGVKMTSGGLVAYGPSENRAVDPNATAYNMPGMLAWQNTRWFGGGGAGIYTIVAGDGPTGIKTFARKTWTGGPTTNPGDSGFGIYGTVGTGFTAGQVVFFSGALRPSPAGKVGSISVYLSDGNRLGGGGVALPPNTWTQVTYVFTVPAGVYVDSFALDCAGSSTQWQVGDTLDGTGLVAGLMGASVTLDAVSGQLTLVGGVMSGGNVAGAIVTGGTVQTSPSDARGVKMTSAGLIGYTAAGAVAFSLSNTGAIIANGPVITSGEVNGAIVTGGTVQTTSLLYRGIKINTAGLAAYDNAGNATLTINASTGSVIMRGDLTSGSTVTGAVVQTADSGRRALLWSAPGIVGGGGGALQLYGGVTSSFEQPAQFTVYEAATGQPWLQMLGPATNARPRRVEQYSTAGLTSSPVTLASGLVQYPNGSNYSIAADVIRLGGSSGDVLGTTSTGVARIDIQYQTLDAFNARITGNPDIERTIIERTTTTSQTINSTTPTLVGNLFAQVYRPQSQYGYNIWEIDAQIDADIIAGSLLVLQIFSVTPGLNAYIPGQVIAYSATAMRSTFSRRWIYKTNAAAHNLSVYANMQVGSAVIYPGSRVTMRPISWSAT
jgi:hypothetical protein